jgi:polysaccharide deacetylase 2 family uncharacterized protein YibQ
MSQLGPEGGRPRPGSRRVHIKTRYLAAVAGVLLLLAAASLVFLSAGRRGHPPAVPSVTAAVSPEAVATAPAPAAVYEEPQEAFLDQRTKEADAAVLKALEDQGLGLDRVEIVAVVRSLENGREVLFQTLSLRLDGDAAGFTSRLASNLAQAGLPAELSAEPDGSLLLRLDGRPTHRLVLILPPAPPAAKGTAAAPGKPRAAPPAGPARTAEPGREGLLAIVIDDLGEDVLFAKELGRLGIPVTFAVWPRARAAHETARIALASGNRVLIHQPMEPKRYPEFAPGPGAVFVNMDDETIRAIVAENISRLPEAEGLNNHMGSRATEDERVMTAVLSVAKDKGLYFLDSLTTYRSVGARVAGRLGLPSLKRDVFLDNVAEVHPILLQLRKAEFMARSHGFAVAIGHPHRATMEALTLWVASRPADIRPVALRDLPPLASAPAGRTPLPDADAAAPIEVLDTPPAPGMPPAPEPPPAPAPPPATTPEPAAPPAAPADSALTPAGN